MLVNATLKTTSSTVNTLLIVLKGNLFNGFCRQCGLVPLVVSLRKKRLTCTAPPHR